MFGIYMEYEIPEIWENIKKDPYDLYMKTINQYMNYC